MAAKYTMDEIKNIIAPIAKRYGVAKVSVFGSYAKGTADEDSDVDLLIDGPYIRALQDFSRPLVGSSNQRFIYLTDRFTPEELRSYRNRFEIRVDPDGTVFLNGMGDLNRLRRKIDNYI